MLIPEREVPTLTEAQTLSVIDSASGILSISIRSFSVMPFCTSAEKPPIKLTPTSLAARSKTSASSGKWGSSQAEAQMAAGVMEILLLTIGIP